MADPTPGPWELWTGCSWRRIGSKATGQTVCEPTVHHRDGHPDLYFPNGGQDGPDARLIVAAPDLLAACRALVEVVGNKEINDSNFYETGRAEALEATMLGLAAIDKAEGRTDG